MYFSSRRGSAVSFDMALEKHYNKTAKVIGGIIGLTRRKEAVALWNITKHERDLRVSSMEKWCGLIAMQIKTQNSTSITNLQQEKPH